MIPAGESIQLLIRNIDQQEAAGLSLSEDENTQPGTGWRFTDQPEHICTSQFFLSVNFPPDLRFVLNENMNQSQREKFRGKKKVPEPDQESLQNLQLISSMSDWRRMFWF